MRTSLLAVAVVWLLGCIWSFHEQSAFAASRGFAFPHLLPLVIDGFAVSMAGVSWAASLDARPAIPARLATVVAVSASSTSNGVWAYLRTQHDIVTVVLGVTVPVAANMAFEVLLAELRRQVQRRRGLPAPVAVPYPRLIRLILAPSHTFRTWRALVLTITAPHTLAPGLLGQTTTAAGDPAVNAEPVELDESTPAAASSPPSPPAPAQPPSASASASVPDGDRPEPGQPPADEAAAQPRSAARLSPDLGQRPNPRVLKLARYLADVSDSDEITGEMVGPLLDITIAPRTGRRLLRLARELRAQETDKQLNAPQLSVISVR